MKTISLARERYEQVLKDGSDIHHHLPFIKESAKGNVMEIGVRQGASTAALLAGIEENGGLLWSVDIKDCRSCFEGHPSWRFIQGDSVKNAAMIKTLIPDALDLLLIDGDHTFEVVLSDLRNYGPRTKVIALHDADSEPGVMQAMQLYCEFLELDYEIRHHSHGLGVITR